MAAKATALITDAVAKQSWNVKGTEYDAEVSAAVDRATDICELLAGRPLKERALTDLRLKGPRSPYLYLTVWPVNPGATITLTVDGSAVTTWRQESDGDPDAKDVVLVSTNPVDQRLGLRNALYRAIGWEPAARSLWPSSGIMEGANRLPSSVWNVRLSYTGGFNPVPDDLVEACVEIGRMIYMDITKQRGEFVAITTPQGGINVAPERIPKRAREICEMYRRPIFGGV